MDVQDLRWSPTWQGPQAINWGDTQDHPISQTFLKPFLIQQDPSRFVEPAMHDIIKHVIKHEQE